VRPTSGVPDLDSPHNAAVDLARIMAQIGRQRKSR
jgi:hypothetical protein